LFYKFKCYQRKANREIFGLLEIEAEGAHNAACEYGERMARDELFGRYPEGPGIEVYAERYPGGPGIEVYVERVEGGAHYRFHVYLEIIEEVRAKLMTWTENLDNESERL